LGAVALAPSLVTNTITFHAPTVSSAPALLQEDGASKFLLEDGSSKLLKE